MDEKQIVCDTDVIIDYWDQAKPRHLEAKNIVENRIGLSNVVLSGITKMELILGALNKSELIKIKKSSSHFSVILVNNEINQKAMSLLEQYTLSHNLALPDSLIAATAICADLELFTYNIRDYKYIKGIRLMEIPKSI